MDLLPMNDNVEFNRSKAEAIIKYMVEYIENVEEDDLTVEEVAEFLNRYDDFKDTETIHRPMESDDPLVMSINRLLTVGIYGDKVRNANRAENTARAILDHAAEDNSRLDYSDDDVYEIAKIIRKRNTSGGRDKEQPLSLNDKKAAAILDYLVTSCFEFEEGDFTAEEIAEILDDNEGSGVEERAAAIINRVEEENSRFEYSNDDVYELARIIRKRRM